MKIHIEPAAQGIVGIDIRFYVPDILRKVIHGTEYHMEAFVLFLRNLPVLGNVHQLFGNVVDGLHTAEEPQGQPLQRIVADDLAVLSQSPFHADGTGVVTEVQTEIRRIVRLGHDQHLFSVGFYLI